MTLARGDKVIKLGPSGEPLTTEQESYIEYEVFDLGTHLAFRLPSPSGEVPEQGKEYETFLVALLRKVR